MQSPFTHEPYNKRNGIAQYTKNDFYWGIVPRQEMEHFNTIAREKGFCVAQKDCTFSGRFDYAENYRRADFHFLLPVVKDVTILDLGSGFGNVTIPMAKYHTKVIAADASIPLLEFSKLRAESEGITNIEYVHIDPLEQCNLPFKPGSFDMIVLNGVLEWVGPFRNDVSPREIQKQFLRQIKSLLKEDGVLYVGIENRMFPGWLRRDPHSKLRWTTILPRPIANLYAIRNGITEGYRTYIYSSVGYRKLLKEAGFSRTNFLYPYNSYREPNYIYSGAPAIRPYLRASLFDLIYTPRWSRFLKFLSVFWAHNFFLSSFIVLAASTSRDIETPFILHLIRQVYPKLDFSVQFVKVPSEGDVAVFLVVKSGEDKPFLEVKVPRLPKIGSSVVVREL